MLLVVNLLFVHKSYHNINANILYFILNEFAFYLAGSRVKLSPCPPRIAKTVLRQSNFS
jgi:hypothetical protein